MKILHLLYAGSKRGGAQQIAIEMATEFKSILFTSTFLQGSLRKSFFSKNLNFIYFSKSLICKWNFVIASDPRAFLLSLLIPFVKKRFLFLHSDRLIKDPKIFLFWRFISFFNFEIICTTNNQYEYFSKLHINCSLVSVFSSKINLLDSYVRPFNFIYFGRFSHEKRLNELLSTFMKLPSNIPFQLTLIGSGDSLSINHEKINVINEWKSLDELYQIIPNFNFVINNTLSEGFSLQVAQGVSCKCLPVTNSIELLDFYNLPRNYFTTSYNSILNLYDLFENRPHILEYYRNMSYKNLTNWVNSRRSIFDFISDLT